MSSFSRQHYKTYGARYRDLFVLPGDRSRKFFSSSSRQIGNYLSGTPNHPLYQKNPSSIEASKPLTRIRRRTKALEHAGLNYLM